MFKRILFLLLAVTFVSFAQAQEAPSLEEILDNYYEMMGGVEKWKALNAMKMDATTSLQGMTLDGVMYMARPNKMRQQIDINGQQIVMAFDGEDAWQINPFATGPEPQAMPEAQAEQFLNDEFEDDFIDYQEKGHTIEYIDTKEVDGTDTYELKLTKKNGDVVFYYLDTEYFIPIMQKQEVKEGPQAGMFMETYQSDYQEVDGLMIPFSIEQKMGGTTAVKITISNVTLDPEMEEGLFSRPKKEEAGEGGQK